MQRPMTSLERRDRLPVWIHRYNWHRSHSSFKGKAPISRLGLSGNNLADLHTYTWEAMALTWARVAHGPERTANVSPEPSPPPSPPREPETPCPGCDRDAGADESEVPYRGPMIGQARPRRPHRYRVHHPVSATAHSAQTAGSAGGPTRNRHSLILPGSVRSKNRTQRSLPMPESSGAEPRDHSG